MHYASAGVAIVVKLVDATKQFLQELRTDESFEALIMSADELAQKLGTDPIFPQIQVRQNRRWFDTEGADNSRSSPNVRLEFICLNYFDLI
jgi:hypothetical protein